MNTCECGKQVHPSAPPTVSATTLAIATVPMQAWQELYDPATALKYGTVFPDLNLPFYVTGGEQNG